MIKKVLQNVYLIPGRWLKNYFKPKIENAVSIITFMLTSLWFLYKYRKHGKNLIKTTIYKQILFTGYDGLKVITFVAFLIGGVVLVIGAGITRAVGAGQIFAVLVKYVIVRELAGLFTAIILIARSGTAIATEIGNMKINDEVDALLTMGVNIRHFIVGPRIVGFLISILCLTTYFIFIAVIGGYLVAIFILDLSFFRYLELIFSGLRIYDLGVTGLKAIAFGLIISTLSCYNGFLVKRSITEVPIFSTKSVASSLNLCFLTYAYLTALSYI